jgi:hypothetical protein
MLVLHIKVVNLLKVKYSLNTKIVMPDGVEVNNTPYKGRLSRKDFAIKLPIEKPGTYKYSFKIDTDKRRRGFSLPPVTYIVE